MAAPEAAGVTAGAALDAHRTLVRRLLERARHPHASVEPRLIETHISSVLLTGDHAYKIKKPVNLGFLDFSTLEKRRFCCEEELRLNRRLAPDIYLDVVAICGSLEDPRLGGSGTVIDYAVRMREFPQAALLDGMLQRGELTPEHIDAVAAVIAGFHARAERAAADSPYGGAGSVAVPVLHNFMQIRRHLPAAGEPGALGALEIWSHAALRRLGPLLAQRKAGGWVRECHGDLHLANIAWVDGAVQVFDCIEFNPGLRWIDVISEVAFLFMDLTQRGRADLAWRFLDAWLVRSGDYAGLRLLTFYLAYRALVRAKVACIRAAQPGVAAADAEAALAAYRAYADLAGRSIAPAPAALFITHGVSGSGKTVVSQFLLERLGCVRLRSDVERKRLAQLAPDAASGSGIGDGLYTAQATQRTYAELERLALTVLDAGQRVIVDAAFLQRWQREAMRALARRRGVPFVVIDCVAPPEVLRQRIGERLAAGTDASEATLAVLERQIAAAEPLVPGEGGGVLTAHTVPFVGPSLAAAAANAIAGHTP